MVIGGRNDIGETHHVGPVLKGFPTRDSSLQQLKGIWKNNLSGYNSETGQWMNMLLSF